MKDLSEQIILVTGATDGIGKATALQLAEMGARVIVHGRTGKRAGEALRDFPLGAKVDAIVADFSSLRQVREMAREVLDRYPRLDVLVNNAGVYMKDRQVTEDGYEATFQINYLAPFYLTYLLHELLIKSAPSRIVNVASMVHSAGEIHFDDLQAERRPYDGYDAYAQSKLGNVLFTYDLAERLSNQGVTVNALHPGGVATKLLRAGFGGGGFSVEEGAETVLYLATSPEVEGVTGKYFVDKKAQKSSLRSYDKEIQTELWAASERILGLR